MYNIIIYYYVHRVKLHFSVEPAWIDFSSVASAVVYCLVMCEREIEIEVRKEERARQSILLCELLKENHLGDRVGGGVSGGFAQCSIPTTLYLAGEKRLTDIVQMRIQYWVSPRAKTFDCRSHRQR